MEIAPSHAAASVLLTAAACACVCCSALAYLSGPESTPEASDSSGHCQRFSLALSPLNAKTLRSMGLHNSAHCC